MSEVVPQTDIVEMQPGDAVSLRYQKKACHRSFQWILLPAEVPPQMRLFGASGGEQEKIRAMALHHKALFCLGPRCALFVAERESDPKSDGDCGDLIAARRNS